MWIGYYHQLMEIEKYGERRRIGKLLADRRKELGLTLRELETKSGVTYANISQIEEGKYNVGVDILYKPSASLGLTLTLNVK